MKKLSELEASDITDVSTIRSARTDYPVLYTSAVCNEDGTPLETEINNAKMSRKTVSKFSSLPTKGDTNTLYLVNVSTPLDNLKYDEYIWILQSEDEGLYEEVGSSSVTVDAKLAAYATSADVDTKLKAYAKSADVDTKLADYAKTADTDTKLSKKQDTLTAGEGIKIDTATIKADILPLGSVGDTTETSAMGIINSVINGSYVPMSDIKGIGVDDGTHEPD